MTLPPLPKVLNKREADWTTTVFRKWLLDKKMTGAFEVKHTRGKDSLPFSEVQSHQLINLLCVRDGVFVYKIPDMGDKNPFDVISFHKQPSYIVVKYPKGFVLISPEVFILESKRSKRRSLTWSRAIQISTTTVC